MAHDVPLVFVPGFKGSTLRRPDGRPVWLDGWTVAGVRTPSLALPIGPGAPADDLVPGGPIHSVTLLPGVRRAIYGRFLEAARRWGRPFHAFGYDWRQDNGASAARLERFLEGLAAPAQVIAHSMGGMLALSVLNRRPELFRGLLLAGSPIGGGIGLLEDMHAGTWTGLNRGVVGPGVVATFPSAYSFFPEQGVGLLDGDGTPLPTDFFDARAWAQRRIGLLARSGPDAGLLAWLQGVLDGARRFRASLSARDVAYPPVTHLVADHLPTLDCAQRGGARSVRGWDFTSRPRVPGDGRVRLVSTELPRGIPCAVVRVRREHSSILDETEVVRQALARQLA